MASVVCKGNVGTDEVCCPARTGSISLVLVWVSDDVDRLSCYRYQSSSGLSVVVNLDSAVEFGSSSSLSSSSSPHSESSFPSRKPYGTPLQVYLHERLFSSYLSSSLSLSSAPSYPSVPSPSSSTLRFVIQNGAEAGPWTGTGFQAPEDDVTLVKRPRLPPFVIAGRMDNAQSVRRGIYLTSSTPCSSLLWVPNMRPFGAIDPQSPKECQASFVDPSTGESRGSRRRPCTRWGP
ncbi:hypothetical protein BKA70DRAFT_251617 [Coprinopsis sp. MPI-PUGE-AT-0042]|nr:hypothetical protein BKA70DRAFT_251617 [Coprinopsis sp. MPI-PUGE-AT-0042]